VASSGAPPFLGVLLSTFPIWQVEEEEGGAERQTDAFSKQAAHSIASHSIA
jgi:hypothetical protein